MDGSILVDRSLGLYKTITKAGSGLQCPRDGARVTMNLEVEQNGDTWTKELTIGEGDTLLDEYLDSLAVTMKQGERCKCSVLSRCFDDVNETNDRSLVVVTLLHMPAAPLASPLLSPVDHLDRASLLKCRAAKLVKASQWWLAARRYSRAIRHTVFGLTCKELDDSLRADLLDVRTKCHLNLAACQLSLHDMHRVIKNCEHVLEVQSDNVKALYRRGRALTAINEHEKAEADLVRALELEPDNRQIARQYDQLKSIMQKQRQYYHNALKSMFGGT